MLVIMAVGRLLERCDCRRKSVSFTLYLAHSPMVFASSRCIHRRLASR
jgi:hypothetical protein